MVAEQEASQTQVERILQSKAFRTSELHRNLLSYLTRKSLAGTAESLKEYTVGLDVFGKPASSDPRQESVVRMHTARLRQRLTEYYRTEGDADPIVVDLPKGGFKLTFERRRETPVLDLAPVVAAEPPKAFASLHAREIVLAALLVAVLAAGAILGLRLWRLERIQAARPQLEMAAWTPDLQQLWGPILSTARPLMVCLGIPPTVRVPGLGFVLDPSLNDWSDAAQSKALVSLKQALHGATPTPSYSFTGAGTASGAFELGQFLAPRKQNVLLTRSDLLSLPEVIMDNVVFLGPVTNNRQIQAISTDQELVQEPGGIRNLNPQPGEPAFLADTTPRNLPGGEETYALVSHMPGLYGNGDMLYLSGSQIAGTMAAVRALTDPTLARTLVSKLKTSSGKIPRFYQLVLRVRSMDNMPIEISYVFHRDLSATRQAALARP